MKRQPKKDVLPIQEAEDPKTCENHAETGHNSSKELLEKGKQAHVFIPRADPFDVFRLSNSDEDSGTKFTRKSETSKDLGHPSDTRASNTYAMRGVKWLEQI